MHNFMLSILKLTSKICRALKSVPTSFFTRNWIIFVVGATSNPGSALPSVSALKTLHPSTNLRFCGYEVIMM